MTHELNPYEQKLFDTVISLRQEVQNLREAYSIVNHRIGEISMQADKDVKASFKEAIDIEELARLALVSAKIAHEGALILLNIEEIEKTANSQKASQDTHSAAVQSTLANQLRQMGGGLNDLTRNNYRVIGYIASRFIARRSTMAIC